MKEHLKRVLVEAQELAIKTNKLHAFINSDIFPLVGREEKDLLYAQFKAMFEYLQILGKRLELNGVDFEHKKVEE